MLATRVPVFLLLTTTLLAQVTTEQFQAIKKEGHENSKVMAHLDHLVNRIGPRLTGSDNLTNACEWAVDTFKSFGIANAHIEQLVTMHDRGVSNTEIATRFGISTYSVRLQLAHAGRHQSRGFVAGPHGARRRVPGGGVRAARAARDL